MKSRSFIILLLTFFVSATFAQVNVSVFINGVKSGQYVIKPEQTDGGIKLKKRAFKNAGRLSIEVKGKELDNNSYKRIVDVTDGEDNSLFISPESPGNKGQFLINNKAVLKRLAMGQLVKLYIQMDPANEKSKMPSRKLFIGNLTLK